jgi:hypothetical protein
MKLKMLLAHTYSIFHDNNKLDSIVLRWRPLEENSGEGIFYIGDKNDHDYDHLNTTLKRLL